MIELQHESLSNAVIGAAIEVHRQLGPGLLESAYEECLAREFEHVQLPFRRQVELPLVYRGRPVACSYILDFLVADTLVLELKSISKVDPIHVAQLMTYMRIAKKPIGLLINFNVPLLKDGVTRRVL